MTKSITRGQGWGRWAPHVNRRRSMSLRGRVLPIEHRAAIYTSLRLGHEDRDDPEWQKIYRRRLHALQILEDIKHELRSGRTPARQPDIPKKRSQFRNLLRGAGTTITIYDPLVIVDRLDTYPTTITNDTIQRLAAWLGLALKEPLVDDEEE